MTMTNVSRFPITVSGDWEKVVGHVVLDGDIAPPEDVLIRCALHPVYAVKANGQHIIIGFDLAEIPAIPA